MKHVLHPHSDIDRLFLPRWVWNVACTLSPASPILPLGIAFLDILTVPFPWSGSSDHAMKDFKGDKTLNCAWKQTNNQCSSCNKGVVCTTTGAFRILHITAFCTCCNFQILFKGSPYVLKPLIW